MEAGRHSISRVDQQKKSIFFIRSKIRSKVWENGKLIPISRTLKSTREEKKIEKQNGGGCRVVGLGGGGRGGRKSAGRLTTRSPRVLCVKMKLATEKMARVMGWGGGWIFFSYSHSYTADSIFSTLVKLAAAWNSLISVYRKSRWIMRNFYGRRGAYRSYILK